MKNVSKNCNGITRRNCLHLGLGAMTGFGMVDLLRLRAEAKGTSAPGPKATAKSVILIWMDGGPSHYETFDPKPEAPIEIRGEFNPIATKVPGVQFSQHMKRLASIFDKYSVIRSIRHNQGNHGAGNHYMMTGAPPRIPVGCGAYVSFHPSMGSVVAHQKPTTNNLPAYFSMPRMSRSGGPNFLGAKYAPFVMSDNPNSSNFRVRDLALPSGLSDARYQTRRDLRKQVDQLKRINDKVAGDPVLSLDEYYEQGYSLVASTEAQRAFEIDRESDETRDKYGRNSFGQRALLARRLTEAGVPFITLYEGGWDNHGSLFKTFNGRMPDFENTIATLIEDLDERGMLETTMVLALGEFGRTPKINPGGGRDHWSNAMSVLMAGGGTPGGLALGATDKAGYSAVERVLSPENFVSTVYTKMGIDPDKVLYTPEGRPSHLVSDPTPIPELFA